MKTEHGDIKGDFRVAEEFGLYGVVTGSVVVAHEAVFHLFGKVCGDLDLEEGASAELHGRVNGNVTNRGGRMRVFGLINGSLRHQAGETLVHPKAVVRGGIVGSTGILEESS